MKQFISIIGLLLSTLVINAQDIPARPDPPRLINDFAGILSQEEVSNLEAKVIAFDDSTSTQIVVVTLSEINDDPNMVAFKIGQEWGVGQKDKRNGLVILVKPKTDGSRGKYAIAVGYGLEPLIPDALAKRIGELEMVPYFKENNYYGGIDAAINAAMLATKGQYKAVPKKTKGKGTGILIIIGIILLLIIFSKKNRNNRHQSFGTGSNSLPFWMLMGMGASSGSSRGSDWGSFSSGGGSFGGFGGGSFGGGGASGSW